MAECPTSDKKRYATREGAENAARRSQIGIAAPLYPYTCSCSWWHLSKTPGDDVPADATADPADVKRLQLQSRGTFRAIVADEARGTATLEDRLALRDTSLLQRWQKALKELHADISQQLTDRASNASLEAYDWRRRAIGYRDTITRRMNECRDLLAQAVPKTQEEKDAERETRQLEHRTLQVQAEAANAHRREARNAAIDAQLDREGVPRLKQKELRRQAGEIAIKRLIDAHGTEFSRYLAEECLRIGAELPDRVNKYLETVDTQPLPRTA
jgi:hypothetical protein